MKIHHGGGKHKKCFFLSWMCSFRERSGLDQISQLATAKVPCVTSHLFGPILVRQKGAKQHKGRRQQQILNKISWHESVSKFCESSKHFPRLSGTCGAKLASSGRSNLPDWKTLTSKAHQQLGGYVIHIRPFQGPVVHLSQPGQHYLDSTHRVLDGQGGCLQLQEVLSSIPPYFLLPVITS